MNRSMKRWAFNILAALSLLWFVGAGILWIRTAGHRSDGVEYVTVPSKEWYRSYDICTFNGSLLAGWIDIIPENLNGRREGERGVRVAFGDNGFSRGYVLLVSAMYGHYWGGDGWGWFACAARASAPAKDNIKAVHVVGVPIWFPMLAAAVLPASWVCRERKRRRRLCEGRCGRCGYDLRASKGRCPECGTVISAQVNPKAA